MLQCFKKLSTSLQPRRKPYPAHSYYSLCVYHGISEALIGTRAGRAHVERTAPCRRGLRALSRSAARRSLCDLIQPTLAKATHARSYIRLMLGGELCEVRIRWLRVCQKRIAPAMPVPFLVETKHAVYQCNEAYNVHTSIHGEKIASPSSVLGREVTVFTA